MPEWEGKSKANASGYKIFVFLIKTFGVRSAYLLLIFVAGYYFLFSRSTSRPILNFYRKRLGFSKSKSLAMLYKNYYTFGQTHIDKIALMAKVPVKFTYNFDGEQYLREMVEQKKGGLFLSAHIGNYEAAGHLFKRHNTIVNIVMYDGEDAPIKKYMDGVLGEKTFNVIYVSNDLSHIYKINEALSANEIVCIHGDRFLPGNKTLRCNFLGEEALFPEGPFLLALKLKVPVVYVYAFKETVSHYHFYSTPLKRFYENKETTMQDILKDFVANVETMVNRYPEQWFNYYDFWKR